MMHTTLNPFSRLLLMLVAALALASSVSASQYQVKLEPISELGEALTSLRKLSLAEPLQNHCSRINGLVIQFSKSNPIERTVISRIAQDDIDNVAKISKQVAPQALSKMLFAALDSYVEKAPLDKAYLDLIDCVRFTFQGSSQQVIRDLASDRYVKPALQLQAILNQQAQFLIDPEFQHPTIKIDDLEEPVRRTLLGWFRGDEEAMRSHFITHETAQINLAESKVTEIYKALELAFRQMNGRWKAEQKCHVYTEFAKWGAGNQERSVAERTLEDLQVHIDNSHKIPVWVPSVADTQSLIGLVKASRQSHNYHPILIEAINCLTTVFGEQPKAVEFLNSPDLSSLLDEMESAFVDDEQAKADEPIDDSVASSAEPEENPDEPEDEDESDDEDDEDEDEDDEDDEEEAEEEEEEEGEGGQGQEGDEGEEEEEEGDEEEGEEGDEVEVEDEQEEPQKKN